MVGHGGSSTGSYLADPTSSIPSHCASIVVTSTLRVKHSTYLDEYVRIRVYVESLGADNITFNATLNSFSSEQNITKIRVKYIYFLKC